MAVTDTLPGAAARTMPPADTAALAGSAAAADSIALADSVAGTASGETGPREGLVMTDPAAAWREEAVPVNAAGHGMSWVFMVLAVLFCATALRFKNSSRYLKALLSDLTSTRPRHNAFDETVRETSLLVLLNLLWTACAGVLLQQAADPGGGVIAAAVCTVTAAAYLAAVYTAYWTVGNVFADRSLARLWLKGAAASTGLETVLLFPIALLTLCYASWRMPLLWAGAGAFLLGKGAFLFQGFRIFFNSIGSWLLFLYYLCSLEIIPILLTYAAAVAACSAL